jgi:hypothetical protein
MEKDVLRLGGPTIDPKTARVLELHATSCRDCREALTFLRSSVKLLRSVNAEATGDDLSRIEQKLLVAMRQGEPRRRRTIADWIAPRWYPAIGAAAIAAAVTLAIVLSPANERMTTTRPVDQPDRENSQPILEASVFDGKVEVIGQNASAGTRLPFDTPITAQPKARIAFGRAKIVSGSASRFSLGKDLETASFHLDEGTVAVAIDPIEPTPFVIVTPVAQIAVVGGTVRINRDSAGTSIQVEDGEARILTSGANGREERVLQRGERMRVAERIVATAEAKPDRPRPALQHRIAAQLARPRPIEIAPVPEKTPATAETPATAKTQIVEKTETKDVEDDGVPIEMPARDRTQEKEKSPVEEARALLQKDAPSARRLAEKIIAAEPPPVVKLEATMIAADAARRSGDLVPAIALFLKVANDPKGENFAEEAFLRAARIELQLHHESDAFATLMRARPRFVHGPLLPEREALAAQILRETNRLDEAAQLLDAVPFERPSLPLAKERIEVASKLVDSDPARSAKLVEPIVGSRLPIPIRRAAERVLDRARAHK